MKRRNFIFSSIAGAGLCTATTARAGKLSLDEIETYLNSLKNLKTRFTQINANGTSVQGTLYISRPYKMRFEYDPPSKSMVIGNSARIAVIDGKSNTGPKIYPLRRTPLWMILARDIQLFESGRITGHMQINDLTAIDAIDPKDPSLGTIRMFFKNDPIELSQWLITDRVGQRTTVILNSVESPDKLDNRLFKIPS